MDVLKCAVEIAEVTKTHDDCLVLMHSPCDDAKPGGVYWWGRHQASRALSVHANCWTLPHSSNNCFDSR